MIEPLFRENRYYKQRDGRVVIAGCFSGIGHFCVRGLDGSDLDHRYLSGRHLTSRETPSDLMPGECDKDGNPIAASPVSLAQGGELPDAEGWYPKGSKPRVAGVYETIPVETDIYRQGWNGNFWQRAYVNLAEANSEYAKGKSIRQSPRWRPLPAEQEEASLTGWTQVLFEGDTTSAPATTAPQTSAVSKELRTFVKRVPRPGVNYGPKADPSAKPNDSRPLTAKEQAWKDEQAKKLIAEPAPTGPKVHPAWPPQVSRALLWWERG